jgi:hypothetical protein
MTKMIEIKDWADKHNTFIYTADMQPLGYLHQVSPTDWKAYNASGKFIDWFTSKKAAKAAL